MANGTESQQSAARPRVRLGGLFGDVSLNITTNQLSYYLMRLTGLALVFYVFAHIYSLHGIVETARTGNPHDGIDTWNKMVGAYDTPFGHVIEYLLLLAVVYHMFNGLRLVVIDWFELSQKQAKMLYATVLGMLAICALAAPVFFPELFGRAG
jgi:succinate dehydrogenase / fumarate reductase cytochrome b subunit